MCPPTNANSCYHRVLLRYLKLIWRRKWLIIPFFVLCIFLVLFLMRHIVRPVLLDYDPYENDIANSQYQKVLRRWYNFTDDAKWYNNNKSVSVWDPALSKELLDNWIILSNDSNDTYDLEDPENTDPSMGQAQVIRDIFNDKKNGFFVECGAYDGETRSNTLFLERFRDWTGILIEADPLNFSKMLQKNRKAFLSPTCLSVQPYPVVASFLMANNVGRLHDPHDSSENVSTNSPDVAHTGVHVNVQCFPFAAYIAALNVKTVDYFSLDIEGNEIEVLETIPFEEVDIKALSVEFVHNAKGREYMIDLMDARGYDVHSLVERTDNLANDIIFLKRE